MKRHQDRTGRLADPEGRLHLVLALVLWLGVSPSLWAQAVPDRMNYQGTLLTGQGAPVTAPTDVEFRIWDSPTLTDSSGLKWGRVFRITPDTNGAFNVVLSGEGALLTGAPNVSLSSVFTDPGSDSRYVELTVAGSTAIRPRQRFVASPYAFLAHDVTAARQNFTVTGVLAVNGSIHSTGAVTAASFTGSGVGLTDISTNNLAQTLLNQLVPAGTIIAFAGPTNTIPSGWLHCNGRTVSRATYQRLFAAIGTAWGTGDGSATFHLPDLRGMFLRGANEGLADATWKDPDASSRVSRNAGNDGDAVGSYQAHALKAHRHPLPLESGGNLNVQSVASNIGTDENYGHPIGEPYGNYGGSETRPNNAFVNYIIKY